MTPDLDALLALANAATKGPWRVANEIDPNPMFLETWGPDYKTMWWVQRGGIGDPLNFSTLQNVTPKQTFLSEKDARFIAAANPETVKALIERVRRAEADWKLVDDERVALEARVKAVECEARHLEREWRATQAQREKAYERLAQAEAGAAQLREALDAVLNLGSDCPLAMDTEDFLQRQLSVAHSIAARAISSTPTGSRVLERLKAASDIAACLEHALEIGHLGGGSTKGFAEQVLEAWRRASEADREVP